MRAQAKQETLVLPVRIWKEQAEKIDKVARLMGYNSRSRLVREAIDHYLTEALDMKLVEIRDISPEEAVGLIDEYLARNPGVHYVSEIAEALGIEFSTAFKAVGELIERGEAKVTDE